MMTSHSFFPQITYPTRLSHTSATLIDNLFCKIDKNSNDTIAGSLLNNLSDHFVVLQITVDITLNQKLIKIYPPNNTAVQNIIMDINSSDLYNKLNNNLTTDPNLTYNLIHGVIENAKDKHMQVN